MMGLTDCDEASGQGEVRPEPLGLRAQSEAFLRHMAEKHYSPDTCRMCQVCLGWFITWCEERGLTQPTEVTRPIVERYQRHLFHYRKANGQPLTPNTQYTRLMPVRMWFRWLVRTNRMLYNPTADLEMPRTGRRLPRNIPSAAEMEQVLNVPDVRTPWGLRDRALLETLYSTGMRRMELVGLHVLDVDWERGTVMIRDGKGRRDRMVPIGDRALAWTAKYRDDVRPQWVLGGDAGVLFLTQEGEAFSRDGLSNLVADYVKRSGIGKRGSCHLFRHAMATQMLENGADVRFIQEILGHANLQTTQVYTQVSIRALKAVHTAKHPARLERMPSTEAGLLASLDAEAESE
jgi:integrase/recombinase XerD